MPIAPTNHENLDARTLYVDFQAQIAEEDRVWKNFCHSRWRRVNVEVVPNGRGGGAGSHRAAYASLNGWRDPASRLRRTILSTAPGDVTVSSLLTTPVDVSRKMGPKYGGATVPEDGILECDQQWTMGFPARRQSLVNAAVVTIAVMA